MKNATRIFGCVAIIVLLAFTTHKPYTGNWAGLASNQWISYEDVQNGISTGALTAIPGGTDPSLSATKWITKDQFTGWVQTTSVSGAGNQWITKSMVSAINLYNIPLKGYNGSGSGYSGNGFTSSSDALTYGPSGSDNPNMWWTSSSLSTGMDLYLYTNPGYSYALYSPYDNLWWYEPTSGCAVQLHGINTSGPNVGNPMRISAINCAYSVNWSWDNSHNVGNRSLSIYKNGSLVVSETMGSNSSSFTIVPGDNIQVVLTCSGFSVYCQAVDVGGGATYSSSNCVDATIDSGSLSPSGGVFITASVYN